MGRQFMENGWTDREVTVRKNDLLNELTRNRDKHVTDYLEACKGYQAKAIQRIEEVMNDLKAKVTGLKDGKMLAVAAVSIGLQVPVNHKGAYDQQIKMVEMSVDENITLTAGQFACFVMDDWDWKADWGRTISIYNNAYAGSAADDFGGAAH